MKNKIISFLRGIGTIFIYIITVSICSLLFSNYYQSSNIFIATISQLGTYLILLIVLSIIYHKRLINDFKNYKKEYNEIALKNWLCGLSIMIISNIIISCIIKDISTNEALNRNLLLKYPISNVISMVFLGPMIEEITFRASFKDAFKKWYTFAIFTSLIFGLAHIAKFELSEMLFIIPYGALGFFFAKTFYETNNIYSSFIIHSLHNALCIIIIFLL